VNSFVPPLGENQEGADPMELDQQNPTRKAVGGLRLNQRLKEADMIAAAVSNEACSSIEAT